MQSRFDSQCLTRLLAGYNLDSNHRLLSDWHALTFEVYRNGHPSILRISHESHRTSEQIEAELDWMEHVRNGGIKVPSILLSKSGKRTEIIASGDSKWTAVLFEKLDGRNILDSDWNADLFEKWGALVGRLHRLSTEFEPSNRRAIWHDSDFLNIAAYIPDELAVVKNQALGLLAELRNLPMEKSFFGLMHADVYHDNFFISEKGLQLFDFDNCESGFFVNDIAIALYAALWRLKPEENRQHFAEWFLKNFWKGYCTEFHLDERQLKNLPLFLRLRDLLIYIVTRKKRDLTTLTSSQSRLLNERENRIAVQMPVVNVEGILA